MSKRKEAGFWPDRRRIPLGAAYGAEEDGVGGGAKLLRRLRERLAEAIDGDAAEVHLL